jgi:hypothetical protein
MKKIFIIIVLFFGGLVSAQPSVNNYQYVIVPSRFSFQHQKDQYRLNTLTKLLLEKYGFKAYLDTDDIPEEISNYNCNKLYADVLSTGGFIRTKLSIVLKDCKNRILYTSIDGISKEKEYAKAYNEAIRAASKSFATLNYHYVPAPEIPNTNKPVIAAVDTALSNAGSETLFAQPIANGFQLVDSTPKIVMKIYKTSNPETFTAVKGEIQGVLVSKAKEWFFEYYHNDVLVSEKVLVRF